MIYTATLLIILISILLLYNQWKFNKGVLFLIFGLVFVGIRYLTFFLIFNQEDIKILALWFLHTDPLSCLISPAFYFYLQSLVITKRPFKATKLLHLIPAFLIALNTLPYYVIPLDEKVKVLSLFLSSPSGSLNSLPYLLFNYRFQKVIPSIISVAYFLFFYYKFVSKRDVDIYISKNVSQLINQLLVIFSVNIFSAIILVIYVNYSSIINSTNMLFIFSDFSTEHKGLLYFMSLIFPLSLFFSPQVLFFKIDNTEVELQISDAVPFRRKLGRVKQESMTTTQSEDLKRILLYIGQHRPYLNTGFSLHEISRELNIPHARVTYCFNKELSTPFPIYRNKLRVSYAESLIREGEHLTTTIEGIAAKSGFRSPSVFYAAFREIYEMTPAEWIKENL
jgi:AraC-like DNA-binding protein